MSVNIRIAGRNDFHCPLGWTVGKAIKNIREGRGLRYGEIENGGVAMDTDDVVTSDGEYHFVNFQEEQGIFFSFSFL